MTEKKQLTWLEYTPEELLKISDIANEYAGKMEDLEKEIAVMIQNTPEKDQQEKALEDFQDKMQLLSTIRAEMQRKQNAAVKDEQEKRFSEIPQNEKSIKQSMADCIQYELASISARVEKNIKDKKIDDVYIASFIIDPQNKGLTQDQRDLNAPYFLNAKKLAGYMEDVLPMHTAFLLFKDDKNKDGKKSADALNEFVLNEVMRAPYTITVNDDLLSRYEVYAVLSLPGFYFDKITTFMNMLTIPYIKKKLGKRYKKDIEDTIKALKGKDIDPEEIYETLKNTNLISIDDFANMYISLMSGAPADIASIVSIADIEKNPIITRMPSTWVTPKDVISNKNVFLGFLNDDETITRSIDVSRKNKKIMTKLSLNFDAPDIEIYSKKPLDGYARSIHDAYCSQLIDGGNVCMTPRMIYRAMTGDKDAQITPKKSQEILDYVRQMIHTPIMIDASAEAKLYGRSKFHYEGNVLNAEIVEQRMNGATEDQQIIHALGQPPLYMYANMKNQVGRAPISLLDIPRLNQSKEVIQLRDKILHAIMGIKGGMNNHILIDNLLSDMTAASPAAYRMKKKKSLHYISIMLDSFKKQGYIKGYSILGKDGEKATGNTPAHSIKIDI